MAMTKINILAGTDRPNSNTLKFSNYMADRYREAGAEVTVISLEDYPIQDVAGGKYGKDIPTVKAFNDAVLSGDGLLFVVPEYNGGFPGILKLFIDYLPFPKSFMHYPLAFVGVATGAFGALRPIEQLQAVCNYRNAFLFPERVFMQRFNKIFVDGEVTDAFTKGLIESQVTGFIDFVERLKREPAEMAD